MILTEVAAGQPFSIDPRWRQLSLGGTLLAAVAVSLLDWFTPQVAGIPLLYLVILWTSLWWAARPQVIIVAALASVLTLAIYPAPHAPEWVPDGVGRVVHHHRALVHGGLRPRLPQKGRAPATP